MQSGFPTRRCSRRSPGRGGSGARPAGRGTVRLCRIGRATARREWVGIERGHSAAICRERTVTHHITARVFFYKPIIGSSEAYMREADQGRPGPPRPQATGAAQKGGMRPAKFILENSTPTNISPLPIEPLSPVEFRHRRGTHPSSMNAQDLVPGVRWGRVRRTTAFY